MADRHDASEKMLLPIEVQVCYASKKSTTILELTTKYDSTIRDVIEISQILINHPEVDIVNCKVGIFGKLKTLRDSVRQGDRVEIYRALTADPMEARRRRSVKQSKIKPIL